MITLVKSGFGNVSTKTSRVGGCFGILKAVSTSETGFRIQYK